jgi:TatD DNase family protein
MKSKGFRSADCGWSPRGTSVFDSHVHLDFPDFQGQLAEQLRQAELAGVSAWLVPGYGLEPEPGERELCDVVQTTEFRGRIFRAVGFHPWQALDCREAAPEFWEHAGLELRRRAVELGAVAIGETGFDGARRADGAADAEWRAFGLCLELAQELDLPLIVHCVRAEAELRQALRGVRLPKRPGVIHAFHGSLSFAEWLVGLGFRLGIGQLFLAQAALAETTRFVTSIQQLPLQALVLETDSTGPTRPPAGLLEVARALAQARREELETVVRVTRSSAIELVGGSEVTACSPPGVH